jgi:hypothetical protein
VGQTFSVAQGDGLDPKKAAIDVALSGLPEAGRALDAVDFAAMRASYKEWLRARRMASTAGRVTRRVAPRLGEDLESAIQLEDRIAPAVADVRAAIVDAETAGVARVRVIATPERPGVIAADTRRRLNPDTVDAVRIHEHPRSRPGFLQWYPPGQSDFFAEWALKGDRATSLGVRLGVITLEVDRLNPSNGVWYGTDMSASAQLTAMPVELHDRDRAMLHKLEVTSSGDRRWGGGTEYFKTVLRAATGVELDNNDVRDFMQWYFSEQIRIVRDNR